MVWNFCCKHAGDEHVHVANARSLGDQLSLISPPRRLRMSRAKCPGACCLGGVVLTRLISCVSRSRQHRRGETCLGRFLSQLHETSEHDTKQGCFWAYFTSYVLY